MTPLKFVLLGLFIFTFCQYEAESAIQQKLLSNKKLESYFNSSLGKAKHLVHFVFHAPVKSIKIAFRYIWKFPTAIYRTSKFSFHESVKISDDAILEAYHIVKKTIASLIDKLVSVGVFEGSSAEYITKGSGHLVQKTVRKIINGITRINTSIVDILMKLSDELKLKQIKKSILEFSALRRTNSPYLDNITMTIKLFYYRQINELQNFMKYLYNKNDKFLTPFIRGIVNRIIIGYNSGCGLIHGKSDLCPAYLVQDHKIEGLEELMRYYRAKLKAYGYRFYGFSKKADKYHDEAENALNQIKSHYNVTGPRNHSSKNFGYKEKVVTGPYIQPIVSTKVKQLDDD